MCVCVCVCVCEFFGVFFILQIIMSAVNRDSFISSFTVYTFYFPFLSAVAETASVVLNRCSEREILA